MRDKIVATQILQLSGVPTPEAFTAAHPSHLAPLLDKGPLVVKPYRGSQGRGVRIIWDPDDLNDVPANQEPIFAQRYHKPDGPDRKIYCIGSQVFGVRRVWPARTYEEKVGEAFTLTPELHEIALRTCRAFGVELCGLDVIVSDGQPLVVDASSFPGFKGVPDAALRMADYIYSVVQRVLDGGAVLVPAIKEMTP